ncbi:HAD family hydrolase [Flavobacterium lacus]|uniref:phosphoglycolate phosphatase n=1 Tax=Flavobacterium lacus TaxID=1353778 RepID=A0A328WM84_9FLAO|nr:HAD hydrolase-like protein [Flavobacterium lacus]RAR47243.1 phosphoglycolate phosphatase-like HAD superfamily hydrolase [Flavobacterium lacus]
MNVIFWDFDGVLMDSNAIRNTGFEKVLADYPPEQVEQLLSFHKANGGLSRYVKFRYFFEKIRNESVMEEQITILATRFSVIMKDLLLNEDLLFSETLDFVKRNQGNYKMHITSGSDQEELRYLCESLKISYLFDSVHGSPTAKIFLIKDLIDLHKYDHSKCVLIGDSINDWEAADANGILFMAYNSDEIVKSKTNYSFIF